MYPDMKKLLLSFLTIGVLSGVSACTYSIPLFAGERLSTVGKGEEDPIAPNDTKEGRSKNRRIEFVVISK